MKKAIMSAVLALMTLADIAADNAKYVNMFLGSSGDHGQLTPGAAVPFGMISVCPDSNPHQHGGYDYDVPRISGISINRISGVGCGGSGGNLSVKPAAREDVLEIVKGTESAHPGWYHAVFNNNVKGEFTASANMAVERYVFPEGQDRVMFIDFSSSVHDKNVRCFFETVSSRLIKGWVVSPTACAKGLYKLYFNISSDRDFEITEKTEETASLRFPDEVDQVELRIAVSPVDQAAADEIQDSRSRQSFDKIHSEAVKAWKEKLDKIRVKGSTEEQKTLFYTFLYRVYLSPMMVTSSEGRYKGTDGLIYSCGDFTYYSSWCIWDSFRAKFPFLALVEPETMKDICRSLADVFRTGKKDWATLEESVPTVRTEHSVIMLLDSYGRGVADKSSLAIAYPGMKIEAERLPMRSPDQKLESSYDLWALGRIARILGKDEDAARYSAAADSIFLNVWPSEFMKIDGSFAKMKGNGLYQGSRWQYRWAAPHCIDRMIELTSRETLNRELKEFFDKDLFNQGNEPDIHTPFLFNMFGNPDKTGEVVRDLLTKEDQVHLYGGNAEYPVPFVGRAFQNKTDGLAPEMDEDDGTMSAWYLFSSMGMYPVVVGNADYELFSPLYDKIRINNGKARIVIATKGRKSADDPVKDILVNGKSLGKSNMTHDLFKKDCKLVFVY